MAYPNDWALSDEQCVYPGQHQTAASQYVYGWDAWLPAPHVMNLSYNQNGSPTYDQMSAAMPPGVGRCRAIKYDQVGGGSCCNGCKKGKGCEGDKVGQLSQQVGERAVPFSKAEELNSEIIKLSAAVGEWATKIVGAFQPGDDAASISAKFPKPSDGEFFLAFRLFKTDWDNFLAWRRDNPPPWYSPYSSYGMYEGYGDLPQYDALLARYESALARFTALGGKTAATVPDQRSPVEKGLSGGAEEAGSGVAKVFAALGTAGTVAVLGLGLYIVAPLIPGMVTGARNALRK